MGESTEPPNHPRSLMAEFDSQRDIFADSSAESAKRPRVESDVAAVASAGPTQMISDASQAVAETQDIEEGTSSPVVKVR